MEGDAYAMMGVSMSSSVSASSTRKTRNGRLMVTTNVSPDHPIFLT
jgi:hypothetical protein